MPRTPLLLLALLLLLIACDVQGDVRSEAVQVRLLPSATYPTAGKTFRGTIEISALTSGEISQFHLQGEGWSVHNLNAPDRFFASGTGTGPLQIQFQATPILPNEPLILTLRFNGQEIIAKLNLSAGRQESGIGSGSPSSGETDSPPLGPTSTRHITVHGRLAYQRNGGATIGAYGVAVSIYDEDITFDSFLGSGNTDSQGYYSIAFDWNDCLFCENPDIYVHFETDNSIVQVMSPLLFDYKWETGTTNNFTGTDLDKNTFYPGSDQGALHIFANIVRAWHWLNDRGYATPGVDVTWPSNVGSGAYYNPLTETIHLYDGEEWDEVTAMHEYSHHWHNMFGTFSIPDYLDPHGGLFGHCMWCGENDLAAWEEGWADWLSDKMSRDLGSPTCDDAENTAICSSSGPVTLCGSGGCPDGADNLKNYPYVTEGFVAAVLRDIEDSGNELDPLSGGTLPDALSLNTAELLSVADQDAPTSISGFFSAFKVRFPQYTSALWQTARNNSFELDSAPPGPVAQLHQTPTFSLCLSPGKGNTAFAWTRAADDWSGVDGYSILISTTAQLPDAIMDIGDVQEYSTSCLTSGDYMFNIRAHDRSGKWSTQFETMHFTVRSSFYTYTRIRRHPRGDLVFSLGGSDFPVQSEDRVLIEIFDVSGRLCRTFPETSASPGEFTLDWNGVNDEGRKLPKGVYFARISSALTGAHMTQRLVLVR